MTAKRYRVTVTTRNGSRTHWIEYSNAKQGAAAAICDRAYARLAGLDIDEIEVNPA